MADEFPLNLRKKTPGLPLSQRLAKKQFALRSEATEVVAEQRRVFPS